MPTATITSKGQLTLPKSVREQAGTRTGDRLEVMVSEDGSIVLRAIRGSVEQLFGLLRREGQPSVSVEEMDEAIAEHLAEDNERILRPETEPESDFRHVDEMQ